MGTATWSVWCATLEKRNLLNFFFFQHAKVNQWTNGVVESCLARWATLRILMVDLFITTASPSSRSHSSTLWRASLCRCLFHDDPNLSCKRLAANHNLFFVVQKNGAGLHTASSCYWDNSTDGEWLRLFLLGSSLEFRSFCVVSKFAIASLNYTGSCTVRWENKTMYCIVSVFGLAIWGECKYHIFKLLSP